MSIRLLDRVLAIGVTGIVSLGVALSQVKVGPRPLYLSGKVVTDAGTPPPQRALIEIVCGSQAKALGNTNSKGEFNVQPGGSEFAGSDATYGNAQGTSGFEPTAMGVLNNCVLRAVLSGYRSESINLNSRMVMDHPDVGTILIRKSGSVDDVTVSLTSLQAPKDAKKAHDKGIELLNKRRTADAEKELKKAVDAYPKYAAAWSDLARVYLLQGRKDEARKALAQAVDADSRFVKPHLQLLDMSLQELNWQQLAEASGRVIQLDRTGYPRALFYNSLANFNLKAYAKSEESVQATLLLDAGRQFPKAYYLLGLLQALRSDYKGSVESLRTYLPSAPAGEVEMVKKQLAEFERKLGQ